MKQRVQYSIPMKDVWDRFHQWSKATKNTDGLAFYKDLFINFIPYNDPKTQQALMLSLNLWLKDYNKETLHIWLDEEELYPFLSNEVPLKELYGIKQYLFNNGEHLTTSDTIYQDTYKFVRHDIAVHIPNEELAFAFSFELMQDETLALFFMDELGVGQIHESQYEQALKSKGNYSGNIVRDYTFAVNLLAYMSCFPECVREGVPDVNNKSEYKERGQNLILETSEKLFKTVSDGRKRPHFRAGYFKVLKSDFYKNKRGQMIWVSETTVNAKSKTVEKSENERKVESFKQS